MTKHLVDTEVRDDYGHQAEKTGLDTQQKFNAVKIFPQMAEILFAAVVGNENIVIHIHLPPFFVFLSACCQPAVMTEQQK